MDSEIQSDTDRFFCHFKSLFALLPSNNLQNQNFEKMKHTSGDKIILCMCTKNHVQMVYCFLRYRVQQTEDFVSLGFYPSNNLENQDF